MDTIVRYNPWNEMATLNRFLGRWMEEAMGGSTPQNGADWTSPSLDVKETPENFEVSAELPGWKPENVDISVERGVLTLKGELDESVDERPNQPNNTKWHSREIRRTSFVRSITLPTEVQSDKASAYFENGVLTLTLPKAEVVKPKQIKIGVNNGNGNSKTLNSK